MPSGGDQPGDTSPSASRCCGERETLGRAQRLLKSSAFREAYEQDRRWHGRYMVLFLRTAPDTAQRLGVVASRRVGNAVERSRAKRRLRELFRRHRRLYGSSPDDVVLVARRAILDAKWDTLVAEFLRLAAQAGLRPPSVP